MNNNKNIVLQYAGQEYLLTSEYGSFLELKDLLIIDPWWLENQDISLGIGGPDLLAKKVITNVGADWFHSSNDLSSVGSFTESSLNSYFDSKKLISKKAYTFTVDNGDTFLYINDSNKEFSYQDDAFIKITGYSGDITNLSIG